MTERAKRKHHQKMLITFPWIYKKKTKFLILLKIPSSDKVKKEEFRLHTFEVFVTYLHTQIFILAFK